MSRAVLVLVVMAACGGGAKTGGGGGAGSGSAAAAGDPACPVEVPGTSVSVEDTDTGAALVFVTTGDAADVRTRAAAMAAAHSDAHAKMGPLPTGNEEGGGHAAHHGASGSSGGATAHAGTMISIHSGATAEDIDGGARIVFVAAPADVNALRDELRMHARHFAAGTCTMDHD
jgi:hypothetical protein